MNDQQKSAFSLIVREIMRTLQRLKDEGNRVAGDVSVHVNTECGGSCYGRAICLADEPRQTELVNLLVVAPGALATRAELTLGCTNCAFTFPLGGDFTHRCEDYPK